MKTKLLTLFFLLAAPGSTDLFAQETTRKFPRQDQNAHLGAQQRPSREQIREHLMQRFDKDGDGRLNQEERRAARMAMRARRQGTPNSSRRIQVGRDEARRGRGRGEELRGGQVQGQRRELGRREQDQPQELLQRRGQRRNFQGQGVQRLQRGDRGQNQQDAKQQERHARIMQHFDVNQDGKLDQQERVALKEAMQKRRAEMQRQGQGSTREARPERGRQGRESASAPRFGRRQFPR